MHLRATSVFVSILLLSACSTSIQLQPSPPPNTTEGKTQEIAELLKSHIDSFTVTITLSPVAQGQTDPYPGLRSLFLYTSPTMLIEPHAFWPNGMPISADARITEDEALATINFLAKNGLLARAEKYYSERTAVDSAFPPPEDAEPYAQRPPARSDPHYSVKLTINDEHWYTYYEAVSDWDAQMVATLRGIRQLLREEAGTKMDLLLESAKAQH